ncbi:MAG: Ada metal-binding domain-containing protein [Fulvivirga sp.]
MIDHKTMEGYALLLAIKRGIISYAGNSKLKIYGRLNCKSGKRMKAKNRVFFKDRDEALNFGYRPCGHCLKEEYKNWKNGII